MVKVNRAGVRKIEILAHTLPIDEQIISRRENLGVAGLKAQDKDAFSGTRIQYRKTSVCSF